MPIPEVVPPWRESEYLPRIEHCREPPGGDMQRRGGSGQPVKGLRTKRPKARKEPTANASINHPQEQLVERLTRERDEALEQLAATSQVLRVISSSPGELEPVFQAMLANATRICGAKFGLLYRIEGGSARIISKLGMPASSPQRARSSLRHAR